ncbi:MAG: hypothetical protein K6B64_04625 [Acholeplasmatales bacterium]|nr:hypothetical protein [Acholeplasmatales bacterium]
MDANKILKRLLDGNLEYMDAKRNHLGDISKEIREKTHHHGQNPIACCICCSDSRVIPEKIFMVGIGDLFVIRVAGNVLDNYGIASLEYAICHLNIKLVMVLGHTKCGAIGATIHNEGGKYINYLVEDIKKSIGNEEDMTKASILNVKGVVNKINDLNIKPNNEIKVVGAIYHTLSGKVDIIS